MREIVFLLLASLASGMVLQNTMYTDVSWTYVVRQHYPFLSPLFRRSTSRGGNFQLLEGIFLRLQYVVQVNTIHTLLCIVFVM
jgi:hypothetical protein